MYNLRMNNFTTKDGVKNWLNINKLTKNKNMRYVINDDLTIDVKGVVVLTQKMTFIPVNFKKVEGHFCCSGIGLETLKGCPATITGTFDCSTNNLNSLEFSPLEVEIFNCSENKIKNFQKINCNIKNNFICDDNPIESMENFSLTIGGVFPHSDKNNYQLKSLENLYENNRLLVNEKKLKAYILNNKLQGLLENKIINKNKSKI